MTVTRRVVVELSGARQFVFGWLGSPRMAHAEHFLSRLERLAPGDVEVALSLYRNSVIVEEVIARAGQTEAARVALALSREPDGPHLVVTSAGDFVTCLGPGMTLGALKAIPRATLDAVMARRTHEALADALAGGEGRGPRLLSRLHEPETLSREEFLALSAYQPAIEHSLLVNMIRSFVRLREVISECQARGRVPVEAFQDAWARLMAHGNCAALVGLTARELFERSEGRLDEASDLFAIGGFRFGHFPSCVRGLWASARMGKDRLLRAKRLLFEARTPSTLTARAFEVAALGLAHAKLASEARKVFDRDVVRLPEVLREFGEATLRLLGTVLDDPEGMAASFLDTGRDLCVQRGASLPPTSSFHFTSVDAVPEGLARAAAVNVPLNLWVHDEPGLALLSSALPFLARASAGELYLPEAALVAWGQKAFRLDVVKLHIDALDYPREPLRRQSPRLSPNAPCPCGSGKKLKRCCVAA